MNTKEFMLGSAAFDFAEHWSDMSPGARQKVVLLGAMTVIAAGIAVWAVFFRDARRRRHRRHHREPASDSATGAASTPAQGTQHSGERVRSRRRRRELRPRNPTLAETGGLPPVRSGQPPEILP